jgi:glutathione S-transferase
MNWLKRGGGQAENVVPNGLTLWGTGTVRQLRPHWMLAELGLDYEFVKVHPRSGQTTEDHFLKINPRHKVPVLRHKDLVLCESAAICLYLADAFPKPDRIYVPNDPAERARLNEWCYFIMSELDGHALYIIRRHLDLKALYGESPTAVDAARAYFNEQFEPIAPRLGQQGRYLFGDMLSVADIILGTTLDWALMYQFSLPQVALDYRARLVERPAYNTAKAKAFAEPVIGQRSKISV